jgi:hypothetical protein
VLWEGVALFSLFGVGATISATAINALLVDRIPKPERGAAMTLLWILTLGGFIAGSVLVSLLYPEFDPATLPRLFALLTVLALGLTIVGAWGIEPRRPKVRAVPERQLDLRPVLRFLGKQPPVPNLFPVSDRHHFFFSHTNLHPHPFRRRSAQSPGGRHQPVRHLSDLWHSGGHDGAAYFSGGQGPGLLEDHSHLRPYGRDPGFRGLKPDRVHPQAGVGAYMPWVFWVCPGACIM